MNTVKDSGKKFKVRDFRFYVQTAFTLLCVWIGIEFYFFISIIKYIKYFLLFKSDKTIIFKQIKLSD